jgi:hypothetical protein
MIGDFGNLLGKSTQKRAIFIVDWSVTWCWMSTLSSTDWDRAHSQKTTLQAFQRYCVVCLLYASVLVRGALAIQSTMASNLQPSSKNVDSFLSWISLYLILCSNAASSIGTVVLFHTAFMIFKTSLTSHGCHVQIVFAPSLKNRMLLFWLFN